MGKAQGTHRTGRGNVLPAIGKPGIRARSLSARRVMACVKGEQVSALNGYVRQDAR
ncbi:hypothetical protein VG539_000605 [Cronobacter muytjensii]|uniref:hypothetical protein n=1 Tax=Cronobacter muytjensii TaxID=413501 RepID=UPI0024A89DAC|nr:hypothetical protein [Cronobacter muytjensii]MDI6457354.1 hypothetical protein [Cronobacter muytjensii]